MIAHGLQNIALKDATWHGSGHSTQEAVSAITTSLVAAAVMLSITVSYFMFRVYKKEKLFSKPWLKEY